MGLASDPAPCPAVRAACASAAAKDEEEEPVGAAAAPLTPYGRASAVDWMVDAAWQLGLSNDALFLAVALLDRFLAARCSAAAPPPLAGAAAGPQAQLTLTAAVCLWVAAK
jgi:hypothetical protein